MLILGFDGVVTRLDVDWVKVREEASRLVGFRIASLVQFFRDHFGTGDFEAVNELLKGHEMEAVLSARPYDDVRAALESFGGHPTSRLCSPPSRSGSSWRGTASRR